MLVLVVASIGLLLTGVARAAPPSEAGGSRFVVFLERGADDYAPAARALAEARDAPLRLVDAQRLRDPGTFVRDLRTLAPSYAVFVVRPETLDVDLAHALLEASVAVDEDPFPDVAFGFVTGRDGAAARAFVARMLAATLRPRGRRAGFFGSWEGSSPPPDGPLTVARALGLEATMDLVSTRASKEVRSRAARAALGRLSGSDVLLFFSHGLPDEMGSCFRAADLRAWTADLAPAVLVNCACFNGVTGRWFLPDPEGRAVSRPPVSKEDSVALAVLDTGVAAYVAGVEEWHGLLADRVFLALVDDGLALGDALNVLACRLALDRWPERIHFGPTEGTRAAPEGPAARRRLLAGAVLFGDPSFAPFARSAPHLWKARATAARDGVVEIELRGAPLVMGAPGPDFHVAQARLVDPVGVREGDRVRDLALEVYRVASWPEDAGRPARARVLEARCGGVALATKEPQVLLEETPEGRNVHVRVPLREYLVGGLTARRMAALGFEIRVEVETRREGGNGSPRRSR